MASIQERLQIKREPIDKWSIREQLCLASAVARSGDQNWMSVSRALKPFGDSNRPSDWFQQKNCAAQYGALLENVETPKRKKRVSGQDIGIETQTESILRKLTAERRVELKKLMAEERAEYLKLQEDMVLLQSGNVTEEQLDQWCKEIDEQEKQKELEAIAHAQWLKEREQRKQEIERAWRPVVPIRSSSTVQGGQKRKASESIDSSIIDPNDLSTNEDSNSNSQSQTPTAIQQQEQQQVVKPPISPLLTSLLKSPSHAQNIVTSSILHSAITSQRNTNSMSNPTITSLLNSTTNVPVSPGLQQLVSSAIGQTPNNLQQQQQIQQQNQSQNLDILDDATDLPNLKVEDIARTILSSNDPLPEIKNEEVEVIISDLIENAADIVTDPEQHLQLDGSDDIISNLESELDELVNEENAAKEQARLEALQREEQERQELLRQEKLRHEQQLRQQQQEQLRQEQLRQQQQQQQEQERIEKARLEKQKLEEALREKMRREQELKLKQKAEAEAQKQQQKEIEKEREKEKEKEKLGINKDTAADKIEIKSDPFEFEEDPVVFPSKQLNTNKNETIVKEEAQEVRLFEDDSQEASSSSLSSAHLTVQNSGSGSVEIVEVVVNEDEEIDKELNKSQIQNIVHSTASTSISVKEEPVTDSEELEELQVEQSSEPSVFDEQIDSIEMEIKIENDGIKKEKDDCVDSKKDDVDGDGNDDKKKVEGEVDRPTFTPEFADDIFDDMSISVTKLDKSKAKRDYTRRNKKEEKDIDLILATAEQTDSGDNELNDAMSEKEFLQEDKKDVKVKIKQESERSSSPWTEEEEPLAKSIGRRYSTPATPIDSIPNSPASGVTSEDDREYRNWKKSVMLVFNRLTTHKYASLFLKPITNEQAPGYHSIVYRPMDLQTIRKNVESGAIRTTAEFQRDVLLMFNNAIMYNKTNDHVYSMALQMQQESLQQIQILLQVSQNAPNRRETRTSEPGSKRKRGGTAEETSSGTSSRGKKRKED